MIVIIDNYDSFTHNLYQYFLEITKEDIRVIRHDELKAEDILELSPRSIVIGPGPGRPEDAGISLDLVKCCLGKIPLLGVCLGHQCIAQAFGARIVQAQSIVHGKSDVIQHDGRGLFRSIPQGSQFTRYHSLAVEESTLIDDFDITARSSDGEIMGIRHKDFILEGVQFHPESIASNYGRQVLKNFLTYRRELFDAKIQLDIILSGKSLSEKETEVLMMEITEGNLSDIHISSFLTALSTKGISAGEIAGCARVLRQKKIPIHSSASLLDTCGTGGDALGTFNISSMAALVAASCGAQVAKHGNRAVSSKSGSADFYRELGMDIDLSPEQAEELLLRNGFVFLFAPYYHGAMKHVANVRKTLRIKTIMNLIGPLVNPANASYQLIGVYDAKLAPIMAEAALRLGIKRGLVVHGYDGSDELSVCDNSLVVEFNNTGDIYDYVFNPQEACSIQKYSSSELLGASAEENAHCAMQLMNGEGSNALRDAVCLNAGASLYIANYAKSIAAGFYMAKESLSAGKVKEKLDETIHLTRLIKENL